MMQGITAEGYGWDFIWQNIQAYLNGNWPWVYILLFFELILFTKNKRWMNLGIYPYILFALTVCNPLVIKVAGKIRIIRQILPFFLAYSNSTDGWFLLCDYSPKNK